MSMTPVCVVLLDEEDNETFSIQMPQNQTSSFYATLAALVLGYARRRGASMKEIKEAILQIDYSAGKETFDMPEPMVIQ